MGSLALPCLVISQSHAYESFSSPSVFYLLRQSPSDCPSTMSMIACLLITTRVQASERHYDFAREALNIEFAAKI